MCVIAERILIWEAIGDACVTPQTDPLLQLLDQRFSRVWIIAEHVLIWEGIGDVGVAFWNVLFAPTPRQEI